MRKLLPVIVILLLVAVIGASGALFTVSQTEQAIVLCKALGIEVPDVSDEVKRLVEVRPAPP